MERDSGPCNDPVTQWYFDSTAAQCRKFTYGGCRGNSNRFNSKAECQRECQPMEIDPAHKSKSLSHLPVMKVSKETCSLPFEAGPCDGDEPRHYFSPTLLRCLPFTYGGCEGNGNNFQRESECMSACRHQHDWMVEGAGGEESQGSGTWREQRARVISTHASGPVMAGSSLELKCLVDGAGVGIGEVIWYLNNVRLDHGAYGRHHFNVSLPTCGI